jgi:hypothetical protein
VITSFFESCFCFSKVIETESAKCSNLSEYSSCRFLRKNLIFQMQSNFVLRLRLPDTFRYSQECIAKTKAPINSSHIVLSNWEMEIL